jgi:hypothetical protein
MFYFRIACNTNSFDVYISFSFQKRYTFCMKSTAERDLDESPLLLVAKTAAPTLVFISACAKDMAKKTVSLKSSSSLDDISLNSKWL